MEMLVKILEHVAEVEHIKNCEVNGDETPLRGNGFLGEFYTGSVKNKDTGEIIYTYIKKMPVNPGQYGPSANFNEYHYYQYILPELKRFLIKKNALFNNIPKFYCASNELGSEYICLENLKIQKYDILDKSDLIDREILKEILDRYGKYHALTFAFKDQNLEKYRELIRPIRDVYVEFGETKDHLQELESCFRAAYNGLKDIDEHVANQVKPYLENLSEQYRKIMKYNGQYSALVHGDCWSNNFLFKFKEDGTIEDIKLIDFQLCRDSTPIDDLSFFLYSSASKEDFKKLDEYLELYHKSFSAFARELGSDPEKLLPLSVLKSEWKTHGLMGIFMGILLWQTKLMHKDYIEDVVSGKDQGRFEESIKSILASDAFRKNTADILLHAVEYGIL